MVGRSGCDVLRLLGAPSAGALVLVVDDDAVCRRVLARILAGLGFLVAEATDGRAGVAQVAALTPWLVFMDVEMPHTCGLSATRSIRQLSGATSDVPVIGVTSSEVPASTCLSAGMSWVLRKPLRPHDVTRALGRVCAPRA